MDKPYTFAQRLQALIDTERITKSDLARACGINKSNVTRYLSGNYEAKQDVFYRIASIYGVSTAWLLGYDVQMRESKKDGLPIPASGEVREIDQIYSVLNDDGQKDLCRYGRYLTTLDEYRKIEEEPVVKMIRHYLVPAAAGYASPIEGEDYEEIPMPEDAPADADFCVTVRGDSMEPYIKDGQIVFVRRGAGLAEFDVGIFYVSGDVYCKQFCSGYGGQIYLLSANPAREDANIILTSGDARGCICFGKVMLKKRLPPPQYVRK